MTVTVERDDHEGKYAHVYRLTADDCREWQSVVGGAADTAKARRKAIRKAAAKAAGQPSPDPVAALDTLRGIAARCEAAGTLTPGEPWGGGDLCDQPAQPYEEWANGGGPNECAHGIAAGLHCTPCGGVSGRAK